MGCFVKTIYMWCQNSSGHETSRDMASETRNNFNNLPLLHLAGVTLSSYYTLLISISLDPFLSYTRIWKMTRTSSIVLPMLALLQNAIAFNMPSSRFLTNTFIRMSDIDTPVEEGAFSPSGYQVFLGNLPFAMDENQLGDLVAGKADRYIWY